MFNKFFKNQFKLLQYKITKKEKYLFIYDIKKIGF